jgi:fatty-acyl-CoA synthase
MYELINLTMGQLLEEKARLYPNQQAVKYIETDYDRTYFEFNRDVDLIAKGLLACGFKKGDHLAMWATNYPEWMQTLFACGKIGVIFVTVNTNYRIHEAEYLLKQSDSKGVIICDGLKDIDCAEIIYQLCPELKESKAGQLNSEKLPFLKTVISIDKDYSGMLKFQSLYNLADKINDKEYENAKSKINKDDVINMQYTSGTTGFPKGVMLTHFNIVNNGKMIGDYMNFSEKDRLCIYVPFFHCFGLVLAIMASVTHAATMVPLYFYSPTKVMQAISEEKCTAVHGVPTMFIAMLEHPDFNKYNFSTMRTGIMAGSPCPVKVMQDVIEKMNMSEITIVYGQTEASPGCTQTSVHDSVERRVHTVGKCYPHVEAKIVDPETGKELPDGTPGEFCARGYNIMKGYYNMPEATALAIDKDGWLHTGDIAVRDTEGYFKITGRIKDMIIRGGENIYPKEIEDFIYTHPKVKDVQVIGIPSKKFGEEIMACIILKSGETATENEIKEYVKKSMSRHKVPSYVKFVDNFPMTASGKIQKFKMREWAVEELKLQDAESIETA